MIQDTLQKLQGRIQEAEQSGRLDPEHKSELLGLLQTLQAEIEEVCKSDLDRARTMAEFADVSTHPEPEQKPALLKNAVAGISSTVEDFEKQHPKLVEVVNRISYLLSNMGI